MNRVVAAKAPAAALPAAIKKVPSLAPPAAVVSRRAALSAVLLAGLSLTAADKAVAITLPFQDSTGGMAKGSSAASGAAYAMEGIKKRGITAGARKKLLAAVPRISLPSLPSPK